MKTKILGLLFTPIALFAQVNKPDAPDFIKQIEVAQQQVIEIAAPETADLLAMQNSAIKNRTLFLWEKLLRCP